MSSNHTHSHNESTKNIFIAFMLNFSFAVFEIIGGIITNSTAILSDAVHDFGDSLSLGLSLVFQKMSNKAPTEKYSYGFKRLSVIGAIINILVLSGGTVFVFTEAINRFINPRTVMAEGMFLMSILGISVNGISVLRMKGAKKILDKTVVMHLLEDLLGWIAVFFVSIVMYFTQWFLLDPILSLIICAIIVKNIYENTKNVIDLIMCATPDMKLYTHIKEHLLQANPNIIGIEKLHIWSMDGEEHVLSAKIGVKQNANTQEILQQIKQILNTEDIHHSTIEFI